MKNHWMPFYPGDYLRDTMHFTFEDHGRYLVLILAYWSNGGPLDDADFNSIMRDASVTHTKRIRDAFRFEGGKWHHDRIDKELAEAKKRNESRSNASRKASCARWDKKTGDASRIPSRNALAMPDASQPQPQPQYTKERATEAAIPTLAEVQTEAAMRGTMTTEQATKFFNHYEGNQLWINQHGKLINWRLKMGTWAANERKPNPRTVKTTKEMDFTGDGTEKFLNQP